MSGMMRKKSDGDLLKRIEALEARLEEKMFTHECLDKYYIDLIHDVAKHEAEVAVANMLQHPIEMTLADIEKAFGHKIKIV